jgi:hypothetical protein
MRYHFASKHLRGMTFLPVLVVSAFFLLIYSCSFDAERENPFDPDSPHYSPGASVKGAVTRMNSSTPIYEVSISIEPGSIEVASASDGSYQITGLEAGSYMFTLEHQQYALHTETIYIGPAQAVTKNFSLNAHPMFDSVSITSQRIQENAIQDHFYRLKIFCAVTDPDGQADLGDFAYALWSSGEEPLEKQAGTTQYSTELDSTHFPEFEVENMLGVTFTARVTDAQGDTVYSSPFQVPRIIDNNVNCLSPIGTTSDRNPTFAWYVMPFIQFEGYSFRLKVYRRAEEQLRYETVLSDSSNIINYRVEDDTLEVGDYYWHVQVEDIYGDYSRSERINFDIQ